MINRFFRGLYRAGLHGTSLYWAVVIGMGISAAVLSVAGWMEVLDKTETALTPSALLDGAIGTVQIFTGSAPTMPECQPGNPDCAMDSVPLSLRLAQLLAPLAAAGAVLRIGAEVLSNQLAAFRIAGMHGHTVICGHGDSARAFARSEHNAGRHVIMVDTSAGEDNADADLRRLGIELKAGDPLDPDVLHKVGVPGARCLIIAPGDDNRALDITGRAREVCAATREGPDNALLTRFEISNRRLWRPLSRFHGLAPAREGKTVGGREQEAMDPLPFNMAALAARAVIWGQRLEAQALLRDQDRLHVVLIGYDDFTEALIGHLPPAVAHPALKTPVISILASDPAAAKERLTESFPELMKTPDDSGKDLAVRDMERRLGPVADVRIDTFRADLERLSGAIMETIVERAPVTTVFVSQESDAASLRTAMIVQDRMRQENLWHSPVLVRLSRCKGMNNFLTQSRKTKRFGEVLQAFGVEEQLCSLSVLTGPMETLAEAIHEKYAEQRREKKEADSQGGVAPTQSARPVSEWARLPETWRDSNRRAADHIFAKLTAAGCHVPSDLISASQSEDKPVLPVPPGFDLLPRDTDADRKRRDRLAELEHASWIAGRRLDGWQYNAKRDDDRQWHPSLIPYDDLGEDLKAYDLDQVDLLQIELGRTGRGSGADQDTREARKGLLTEASKADQDGLIRHDLWIGLIGKLYITTDEGCWLAADDEADPNGGAPKTFKAKLRRSLADHPEAFVSLVTPLAPGADVAMTRAAQEVLSDLGRAYRLLVLEAVPEDILLDDYVRKIEGSTDAFDGFDTVPQDPGESWRADHKANREHILNEETTEWIIDLREPTPRSCERCDTPDTPYQRAAYYIAERAHILFAADRLSEAKGTPAPGGVSDTLAKRDAFTEDGKWLSGCTLFALSPFTRDRVVLDLDDLSRGTRKQDSLPGEDTP